jgi:hypothetical protein
MCGADNRCTISVSATGTPNEYGRYVWPEDFQYLLISERCTGGTDT